MKRQSNILSREEISKAFAKWQEAWNQHDLDAVMEFFHDEVVFENWTAQKIRGKQGLRQAWRHWFAHHGGFRFVEEDIFIDEVEQKMVYRWLLEWPSSEKGYAGRPERRRGVDVVHICDGKIIEKLTYSKTTVQIDGQMVTLSPELP